MIIPSWMSVPEITKWPMNDSNKILPSTQIISYYKEKKPTDIPLVLKILDQLKNKTIEIKTGVLSELESISLMLFLSLDKSSLFRKPYDLTVNQKAEFKTEFICGSCEKTNGAVVSYKVGLCVSFCERTPFMGHHKFSNEEDFSIAARDKNLLPGYYGYRVYDCDPICCFFTSLPIDLCCVQIKLDLIKSKKQVSLIRRDTHFLCDLREMISVFNEIILIDELASPLQNEMPTKFTINKTISPKLVKDLESGVSNELGVVAVDDTNSYLMSTFD